MDVELACRRGVAVRVRQVRLSAYVNVERRGNRNTLQEDVERILGRIVADARDIDSAVAVGRDDLHGVVVVSLATAPSTEAMQLEAQAAAHGCDVAAGSGVVARH